MNKKVMFLCMGAAILLSACRDSANITMTISDKVVNAGYIGNGVEWDPYDEAASWGCEVSDNDWTKLFSRMAVLRPQYVRCMINSPFTYWDAGNKTYNKNRHDQNIRKLMGWCTDNHVNVIFGEYNPPTWEMKQSQEWIDMSVDYLNYLVTDCGFSCIKHFVIFNEPDGDWASTNGNYALWLDMLRRFHAKMQEYPGLLDKVSLAGPDVVTKYKNNASEFDAEGWVAQSARDADGIIGLYDIHAYPGQAEVRSGSYGPILRRMADKVPSGKKIVLGEAGFKYNQPADSVLWAECLRRVEGHNFTKGTDCNMLCYDYFYGLDMPMLAMEAMNNGLSGLALWMLDDGMHSQNDSGKTEDVKIWGLWNILGEEVFHDAREEDIRPLFYSWAMMCRFFPTGCDILKNSAASVPEQGIFSVCARLDGKYSVAIVNVGDEDQTLDIRLPEKIADAKIFSYEEGKMPNLDAEQKTMSFKTTLLKVKAQTCVVISNM